MTRVGKNQNQDGRAIIGIRQREVGDLSPRIFAHRAAASEDLVLRLGIRRKLKEHRGCVNTVSFNADGDILVSGSDDRMIILWKWEVGMAKLSFHSSHSNNVFQARFMPYTDDRVLVTCAADGEVRHAQILENGEVATKMLSQHEGRAHKLAIEPGSSHVFYSCGEDGLVQHYDLRTKSARRLFTCRSPPTFWSIVPLYAITIDPRNAHLFAIAGMDEYAQLFDIRKYKFDSSSDFGQPCDCFCPPHLVGNKRVGITGLVFSDHSELLSSYFRESIYLFTKGGGLGSNPVPPSKASSVMDVEAADGSSLHSMSPSNAMDAGPVPQVYKGHQNYDTVKGVSFFGPNCEYVASGSDCGRMFIWKKKDGELLRVMKGDKHVVNCIQSHPHSTMIASSGIENDIKIWTPNATELAQPVDMDEVMMVNRTDCFATDDSDYDYGDGNDDSADDYFDDDEDDGDDDGEDVDDDNITDGELCDH